MGRLLLFRYHDEHKAPFWSTAGGELKAGEDFRAAARRELLEETGFDADIGRFLCKREDVYVVARSTPAHWTEQYFLVECGPARAPSREGWTEEEHETIRNWRWWCLQEMLDSQETFLPSWLPQLLDRTLRDRV